MAFFLALLMVVSISWYAWTHWSAGSSGPIAWGAEGKWKKKDAGAWTFDSGTEFAEVSGPFTASPEKFDNFLRAKVSTFYRVMFVPYPGFISQTTECAPKYKSLEVNIENQEIKFVGFRIFAGARRQLGTCAEENIAFRVYLGRFQCVRKNIYYDLSWFEPVSASEDGFKKLLAQTTCN
jgi:hypothetical protein